MRIHCVLLLTCTATLAHATSYDDRPAVPRREPSIMMGPIWVTPLVPHKYETPSSLGTSTDDEDEYEWEDEEEDTA